jgi:hypothetical protein
MNHPDEGQSPSPRTAGAPGGQQDGETGLPWPRTWPGTYALVMASFIAWVTLLVVLERTFR